MNSPRKNFPIQHAGYNSSENITKVGLPPPPLKKSRTKLEELDEVLRDPIALMNFMYLVCFVITFLLLGSLLIYRWL